METSHRQEDIKFQLTQRQAQFEGAKRDFDMQFRRPSAVGSKAQDGYLTLINRFFNNTYRVK